MGKMLRDHALAQDVEDLLPGTAVVLSLGPLSIFSFPVSTQLLMPLLIFGVFVPAACKPECLSSLSLGDGKGGGEVSSAQTPSLPLLSAALPTALSHSSGALPNCELCWGQPHLSWNCRNDYPIKIC